MLSDAWDSLTLANLQRVWIKLWAEEQSAGEKEGNYNEDVGVNKEVEIYSTILGFELFNVNDVSEWLTVDTNNPGYQILSDEQIAAMVYEVDAETVESDDEVENEIEEAGLTHSEVCIVAETDVMA